MARAGVQCSRTVSGSRRARRIRYGGLAPSPSLADPFGRGGRHLPHRRALPFPPRGLSQPAAVHSRVERIAPGCVGFTSGRASMSDLIRDVRQAARRLARTPIRVRRAGRELTPRLFPTTRHHPPSSLLWCSSERARIATAVRDSRRLSRQSSDFAISTTSARARSTPSYPLDLPSRRARRAWSATPEPTKSRWPTGRRSAGEFRSGSRAVDGIRGRSAADRRLEQVRCPRAPGDSPYGGLFPQQQRGNPGRGRRSLHRVLQAGAGDGSSHRSVPPVASTDGVHFDRQPTPEERPALLAYLRKL